MVHKPIAIMILPLALAGILIFAVLTAIPSNNHTFAFGNSFTFVSPTSSEENNSAGNGQESNNAGNEQQQSNNAGSTQQSNNAPTSEASNSTGSTQQQSNNAGSTQQSNNTGNAQPPELPNAILAVHNRERAAVGVPPLGWSDKLAADAKPWAEHLIATGPPYNHPSAEWVAAHPTVPEGENLVVRAPQPFTQESLAQFQQFWVGEKKDYHGEPGDFHGVGHYTQMVWRDTKEVGCATATGNGHDVLVCRYSPPGNAIGQKPYSNSTGSVPQSNSTGSVPQSNITGSVPQSNNASTSQASNSTGSAQQQNNNAGNGPTSQASVFRSNSTGSVPQSGVVA